MKAVFIELPAFERHRADYFDDEQFQALQLASMANPEMGDVIPATGGLRKLRFADPRRRKGARGGLRVIFYYWIDGCQFWLYTLFDKDEMGDLTPNQKALSLKGSLES
jgi:hypothetical protein